MTTKTADKATYIEAVGRRKTSIARVRISEDKKGSIAINEMALLEYLKHPELEDVVWKPLTVSGTANNFKVSVKVRGGGVSSQAVAIQHGLSRAIVKWNPEMRVTLKKEGLLTRDSRMKERRKFGLKKARKAPQWSKR